MTLMHLEEYPYGIIPVSYNTTPSMFAFLLTLTSLCANVLGSTTAAVDFGPYGDSESKIFYEDLPDLLTIVPLTALGLNVEQVDFLSSVWSML